MDCTGYLFFVILFCLIKGGDDNDGIRTQENENKESSYYDIALFCVLRWGQAQKGTSYHIIMWPPGVAFAILFP